MFAPQCPEYLGSLQPQVQTMLLKECMPTGSEDVLCSCQ